MPTDFDAPDFDSLDDEPTPVAAAAKPGDFWRLGHSPWWQWNVITLFVSLFALTWFRELAGVSQTATWMICVAVFSLWVLAPAIVEAITAVDGGAFDSTDARAPTAGRAVAYLGSLAILVGIMAYAGIHIGIFSVLAVILMAVAVRARHD